MERMLLRVPEAAEIMALSRSEMYVLIASGQLRAIRIGRAIRLSVDDIQEFIAQRRDPMPCWGMGGVDGLDIRGDR